MGFYLRQIHIALHFMLSNLPFPFFIFRFLFLVIDGILENVFHIFVYL